MSLYWSVVTHLAFDIRRDLHLCIGGHDESYYSDMALSVHMHTCTAGPIVSVVFIL